MEKVKQRWGWVLVLLALTVTGATSPASAKVCSKSGTGSACGTGHGNLYSTVSLSPLNAKLATGKNFTLTSGFVTLNCTESSLGAEVESNGGGRLTSLTFGGCSSNLGSCSGASSSASTENAWPVTLKTGTAPNGTMELQSFTFSFTCNVFGSNVTCRYKAAKVEGAVTGGETASVALSEVPVEKEEVSGGFCSSSAKLHATYSITAPDSLYLTTISGSTALCSKSGTGSACGTGHGNLYSTVSLSPLNAKLATGKNFTFTSGFTNVTCTESAIGAEVENNGAGRLTNLTFGGCSSNLGGSCPSVSSSASSENPWPITLKTGTAPNGTMELQNFTFSFTCNILGSTSTCRYKAASLGGSGELTLTGGETATLTITGGGVAKEEVSSTFCSSSGTVEAPYSITAPDSLYLT